MFSNNEIKLKIKKLSPNASIPFKASEQAAGMDLYACVENETVVKSGETVKIPTGIAIAIPDGYVALIFARSGLSIKNGLAPANCVGVVDSDYRGEIIVGLHNHSKQDYTVKQNERIAQLVIMKLPDIKIEEVKELDETVRGADGFGSTGKM